MNKGGFGGGGVGLGSGGGGGPTAAAAAAAAQRQKALLQRADNDIGSIVDNYSYLVNVARNLSGVLPHNLQDLYWNGYNANSFLSNTFLAHKSIRKLVNDPPVRNSQEAFMMEMRAARMVNSADSLLKLVSELKQTAVFSGFASLNDHVDQRMRELDKKAEKTDHILGRIVEEAAASLKELESHYYSSALREKQPPQQS